MLGLGLGLGLWFLALGLGLRFGSGSGLHAVSPVVQSRGGEERQEQQRVLSFLLG